MSELMGLRLLGSPSFVRIVLTEEGMPTGELLPIGSGVYPVLDDLTDLSCASQQASVVSCIQLNRETLSVQIQLFNPYDSTQLSDLSLYLAPEILGGHVSGHGWSGLQGQELVLVDTEGTVFFFNANGTYSGLSLVLPTRLHVTRSWVAFHKQTADTTDM